MLEKLRKPFSFSRKSFVSSIILGAIVLVFVFLGVDPRYLGVQKAGVVAIVNDTSISLSEYQDFLQRLRERANQSSEVTEEQEKKLRVQALNELIHFELLHQKAFLEGLLISEEEIRETIVSLPFFQSRQGVFLRDRYLKYIEAIRTTAFKFENRVKKEMTYRRFIDYFDKSLFVTSLEKERQKRVNQFKMEVEFLDFDLSQLKKKVKWDAKEKESFLNSQSDVEIKKFYERNKSLFLNLKTPLTADNETKASDQSSQFVESDKETPVESQSRGKVGSKKRLSFSEIRSQVLDEMFLQKRVEGSVQRFREAIESHQKQEVEAFIAEFGLKWKSSGSFGFGQGEIPKIVGSETILEKILKSDLKKGELYGELFLLLSQYYVFRLKDFKESKKASVFSFDQFGDFFRKSMVNFVFSSWIKGLKKRSLIKRYL